MQTGRPTLTMEKTKLRFEHGNSYFEIDRIKRLIRYRCHTLGETSTEKQMKLHQGVHIKFKRIRKTSVNGLYLTIEGKEGVFISYSDKSITLDYVVNTWMESENPDVDSLISLYDDDYLHLPKHTLKVVSLIAIIAIIHIIEIW